MLCLAWAGCGVAGKHCQKNRVGKHCQKRELWLPQLGGAQLGLLSLLLVPKLTSVAAQWLLEEGRGGLMQLHQCGPGYRGVSWAKGGCHGGRSSLHAVPIV